MTSHAAPITARKPKPEHVSLRVDVSPELYGRVSEFRHTKQFETRAMAMVALLNAGLAALAEPVAMPKPVAEATPPAKPVVRRLDPFAGKDRRERHLV